MDMERARFNMVEQQIRPWRVLDAAVLAAHLHLRREDFVPPSMLNLAFSDVEIPLIIDGQDTGERMLSPKVDARLVQSLEVRRGESVLEIGTGSGFQTCILCELGAKVYSIERHQELHLKADRMVKFFGFNARLKYGDGYKGWPSYAPFDRILVTCGAPGIPSDLKDQLAIGGIMIIPVGEGESQRMIKVRKTSEETFDMEEFGTFKFVPMLERRVDYKEK